MTWKPKDEDYKLVQAQCRCVHSRLSMGGYFLCANCGTRQKEAEMEKPTPVEPSPVKLAAKPSVRTEIRDKIIRMLEETLEDAKAGKIETLIMICELVGNKWTDDVSGAMDFPRAIGQLEIIKDAWIDTYREMHGN